MEVGIIGTALSLGVGGVLAIIIFFVYRKDKNTTESRLSDMIDRDIESREKHTEAITELSTFLKSKNGK